MNRLTLFGSATVWTSERPLVGRATQRHRVALLALLATTRRTSRSREALIALLWPDADTYRGRRLLSDSVYRINSAFGGEAILGLGDELALNRVSVASDIADLEAAAEAREWRQVVECYRGPFLDGFFLGNSTEFDQWMEVERRSYELTARRALEALAREASNGGRLIDAADWWQRLATLVPDDSRITLELMRALEAAGNRASAVRYAQAHAELLRDALGVEPDRSVVELADRISGRSVATTRCTTCGCVLVSEETLRSAGGV
jgi:DNA-binding SARP family transcriptional activator